MVTLPNPQIAQFWLMQGVLRALSWHLTGVLSRLVGSIVVDYAEFDA